MLTEQQVTTLAQAMTESSHVARFIDVGYTYLGQFIAHDIVPQIQLHLFEKTLTLTAIFDKWVALTDTDPVYAFAQVIHIFQVLHP